MSMETIKTECQAELAQVQDAKQLADFLTWEYQKRKGLLPCLEEESASFLETAEA